jgi:hypothetical protein
MAAAEERFDPKDGNPHDEAFFLDCYPKDGARRWAAAVPRTFCLGSGTVDLHDSASRAFVALRDKAERPLCIVFPNFDGAYGRHLIASANLQQDPHFPLPPGKPRMAEIGRTSSVTTGTTEGNDIFDLLSNRAVPCDHEVVQLVRRAVRLVEAKLQGSAAGSASQIFKQPEAELECRLRAHAFPPKDPQYTAVRDSFASRLHSLAGGNHPERATDSREGGRLHPHGDETGTDAVVVLNVGACDFSLDTNEVKAGNYLCTAQRTKESWCVGIGSGGHWTVRDEVSDRYYPGERSSLLRDRLCAACAAGRQGRAVQVDPMKPTLKPLRDQRLKLEHEKPAVKLCFQFQHAPLHQGTSCPRCESGTVQLRSGDVVAFSGTKAGRCSLTISTSVSTAALVTALDIMI